MLSWALLRVHVSQADGWLLRWMYTPQLSSAWSWLDGQKSRLHYLWDLLGAIQQCEVAIMDHLARSLEVNVDLYGAWKSELKTPTFT